MKTCGKRILRVLIAAMLIAAFSVALLSCNNPGGKNDSEVEDNDDASETPAFVYTQEESQGFSKSVQNLNKYGDCAGNADALFVVPGLKNGQNFVLQGVEYIPSLNWTLICGYIKPETENPNSVLFVIDMNKSKKSSDGRSYSGALVKELFLQNSDGSAFKGHAGGVAVTQKNVWVANGGKLYRIPLSEVQNAPQSGNLKFSDSIKVPVLASYCSYSDGVLWVGEFEYARDDYKTDDSHYSSSNSKLTAWTVGYRLDESGKDGYDSTTGFLQTSLINKTAVPDFVLWHGEKVQGFAEAGDKLAASVSYGRKNDSKILIYKNPVRGENARACDLQVEINGVNVPCYLLETADRTVVAPPMTEDLSAVKDGENYRIYIATESSAYYYSGYNLFNRSANPMDVVWSLKV